MSMSQLTVKSARMNSASSVCCGRTLNEILEMPKSFFFFVLISFQSSVTTGDFQICPSGERTDIFAKQVIFTDVKKMPKQI